MKSPLHDDARDDSTNLVAFFIQGCQKVLRKYMYTTQEWAADVFPENLASRVADRDHEIETDF